MLAAANGSVALLVTITLFVAVLMAVSRGKRTLRDLLVVRDGRPVLSDEARTKLAKRGLDIAKLEDFIAKTYAVNEHGEIVKRGEGAATEAPAPAAPAARASVPDSPARAKPEPATDREGFRSVWEEQDSGPSIWDEADKASFWGDAEKRE